MIFSSKKLHFKIFNGMNSKIKYQGSNKKKKI